MHRRSKETDKIIGGKFIFVFLRWWLEGTKVGGRTNVTQRDEYANATPILRERGSSLGARHLQGDMRYPLSGRFAG